MPSDGIMVEPWQKWKTHVGLTESARASHSYSSGICKVKVSSPDLELYWVKSKKSEM